MEKKIPQQLGKVDDGYRWKIIGNIILNGHTSSDIIPLEKEEEECQLPLPLCNILLKIAAKTNLSFHDL